MIQLIGRMLQAVKKMSMHIDHGKTGLLEQVLGDFQGRHRPKIPQQQVTSLVSVQGLFLPNRRRGSEQRETNSSQQQYHGPWERLHETPNTMNRHGGSIKRK